MKPDKHVTVSQMVRLDYRTAEIFQRHGINYCCGGNSTLEEVCSLQNLNQSAIQKELDEVSKTIVIPSSIHVGTWSIDFLVDYITHVHHAYLKQVLPLLDETLTSFIIKHRSKYPHLHHLQEVFRTLHASLMDHTKEEEGKIFPYIKQISHTHRHKEIYGRLFVRTLSRPLEQIMRSGQTHIAAQLSELRQATDHYHIPGNACTKYHVLYRQLEELDADIVQHKHLENNVLFPKAITLERELLQL